MHQMIVFFWGRHGVRVSPLRKREGACRLLTRVSDQQGRVRFVVVGREEPKRRNKPFRQELLENCIGLPRSA